MVSYDPPYGFPIRRNGTCQPTEVSCGHTWGDFYACCPEGSVCPGATEAIQNNVCCPSNADCTTPLNGSAHCAQREWAMFYHTGFFCCLDGQTGFTTDSPRDAVGCDDGVPQERGDSILTVETQTFSSTPAASTATSSSAAIATAASTTSTSSSSSSSTTTTPSSPSSSTGSDTNTGAIAGGVVGGVAGVALLAALLFYLLRRRRKSGSSGEAAAVGAAGHKEFFQPRELESPGVSHELSSKSSPVHELAVGNNQERFQLP